MGLMARCIISPSGAIVSPDYRGDPVEKASGLSQKENFWLTLAG